MRFLFCTLPFFVFAAPALRYRRNRCTTAARAFTIKESQTITVDPATMVQISGNTNTDSVLQKQHISREAFWSLKGQVIGTHDGRFHLDEILGCALLLSLPQFSGARIIRTRDPNDHSKCNVLIDVGGQYNPDTNRFDHHQREFDTKFDFAKYEPSNLRQPITKLSSAGLVFTHFGEQILRERYGITEPSMLRVMMREVYVQFVEAVDAVDNGVSCTKDGPPVYNDRTSLSCRIADLYPSNQDENEEKICKAAEWEFLAATAEDEFIKAHPEKYAEAMEARGHGFAPAYNWRTVHILGGSPEEVWAFRKGIKIADEAFSTRVINLRDTWLPGLPILQQALTDGLAGDLAHAAVELPKWSPTEGHIYALERERGTKPISFLVYPSEHEGKDGGPRTTWTIRCVAFEGEPFKSRMPLHETWKGLRNEALGEAVIKGMPEERKQKLQLKLSDFVFCHATGFLGIANSRDAAYEMIRQTLETHEPNAERENKKRSQQ